MENFFIKIDLKSIKKNKNAGNTTTRVNGPKSITFKADVLPDYFIDGENCFIDSYSEKLGVKYNFEGEIFDEKLVNKCFDNNEKVNIEINQKFNLINHLPISKYSYDYENTKIRCCNCKEKIMSNDLKSDVDYWGENYSDRICPNCSEFYCCDLEYESIDEALLKMKKFKNKHIN